jgi:hypothetical protein
MPARGTAEAASPKPRRAPARPRRAAAGRPAAAGGVWQRTPPGLRRGIAVAICVAVVLVGFPVAHAFFGEIGALLLLLFLGGFALGRATAPRG